MQLHSLELRIDVGELIKRKLNLNFNQTRRWFDLFLKGVVIHGCLAFPYEMETQ